jgi:hypothetical protein
MSLLFKHTRNRGKKRRCDDCRVIVLRDLHRREQKRTHWTCGCYKGLCKFPNRFGRAEFMIGPRRRDVDTIIECQRQSCGLNDVHFHSAGINFTMEAASVFVVRHNGRWIRIRSRPFEPERMTTDIAWMQIKEGVTPEEAYRKWFERQRKISRTLQQ